MGNIDWLGLSLRWLHILSAITAAGGSIFAWIAVHPALSTLPDDVRATFAANVRKRWAPIVGVCILFLLVSGLINFVLINRNVFKGYDVGVYHMMFGVKFLLALGVFYIASALSGKSKATQPMRDSASFWLGLNVALIVFIVAISGLMRGMHTAANPDLPKKAAAAVDSADKAQ